MFSTDLNHKYQYMVFNITFKYYMVYFSVFMRIAKWVRINTWFHIMVNGQ
ncbi:Uncharacterised protein [Yersinia enterocolitica]|uniref:Uncharacterized protein n=1 Tax=Yersinia kristensenii TaxID=28152 RepID=A0A0T9LGU5_YERKR|nr:Uncharacterised protein [Yersinia kristensenii]CQH62261.1 Uncharacterised protein [Yersinia enterocolitica]